MNKVISAMSSGGTPGGEDTSDLAVQARRFQHDLHDAKSTIGYLPYLIEISVEEAGELPIRLDELSAICKAAVSQIHDCLVMVSKYNKTEPELVASYLLGERESICAQVGKILAMVEDIQVLPAQVRHELVKSLNFVEEDLTLEIISASDFGKILSGCLMLYGQGLKLHLDHDGSEILVDRSHLVRILTNLIGNAQKYTPEGTSIIVEVSRSHLGSRIVFSDNGPGFEGAPDKIFDLHSQDRVEHQLLGFGIGLNYCKNIIEAHGGSILARNKADLPEWLGENGALFEITLPIKH